MRCTLGLFAVVLAMCLSPVASASVIILSKISSDSTPASVLDATLDFAITGADELTLSVTNDTTAPDEYNINFIYFNATSNVSSLTLDSATSSIDGDITSGWRLGTGVKADGFGTFDFELADGVGISPHTIQPAETVGFVFSIFGEGPFTAENFTSELSTLPPGDTPTIAAAKFVSGPDDDSAYGSAYGGTVPEPGTLGMIAAALVGLALRNKRRA